jgi:hypothetical protein
MRQAAAADMSNVIPLRPHAPIAIPDDTIRADCERLMRRLVRDGRTPEAELRLLADLLDMIVVRVEERQC